MPDRLAGSVDGADPNAPQPHSPELAWVAVDATAHSEVALSEGRVGHLADGVGEVVHVGQRDQLLARHEHLH